MFLQRSLSFAVKLVSFKVSTVIVDKGTSTSTKVKAGADVTLDIADGVSSFSSLMTTAEHAAIDHLKMAQAHLFEETEGRNIDNWLSDIDIIIQKLENRINS